MANILVSLENGVEVAAKDVLQFLAQGKALASKLEPEVVAALGVLLGTVETALASAANAVQQPLNINLDVQTVQDLTTVWPAVTSFAKSLQISF